MDMTKFKNKNGTLTKYALNCGYIETKGILHGYNYVVLYMEFNSFHVKGSLKNNSFWFTFESLVKARRQFNTLKV